MSEFIEDEQQRHMVLGELPDRLRQCLLYGRNFIYVLHQHCIDLSRLGLLSFGKTKSRLKEEVL